MLEQVLSPPNSDPTENERKLMILLKLGSHFWAKDFTRAQAKEFLSDYIEDLATYSAAEMESFAGQWRRDPAKTKFPKIGEIILGIVRARTDKAEIAAHGAQARPSGPDLKPYPDGKSRPILWWMQPKSRWNPSWREGEVPALELIRSTPTSPLRLPVQGD